MSLGQTVRRLSLAGDYTDTDWMNPANPPPASAKPMRATSSEMTFALIGRASTDPTAAIVDVGTLTVDAYLASEVNGAWVRGESVGEVKGAPLEGAIKLVGLNLVRGEVVRIHLVLVGVGALPALEVVLLGGGVVL